MGAAARHARRAAHPIIDLSLLSIPTFRASVTGGSLFRLGTGAIPFLLPLMLQIGFGLTPFASGSLTFAAAAGALAMKVTAGPILRRFGFRSVLTVNAAICAALLAAIALFTAETPYLAIIVVLLAGGFFRSLQFTSINAVSGTCGITLFQYCSSRVCNAGSRTKRPSVKSTRSQYSLRNW